MTTATRPKAQWVLMAAPEGEMEAPEAETPPEVGKKRHNWVLAVEEQKTGDGRIYRAGAFTWRDLPLPFMATDTTDVGHDGAVLVANIVSIERVGSEIQGVTEHIASTDERVLYLQSLIDNGDLRGVSVDMDNIAGEMVFPPMEEEEPVGPDEEYRMKLDMPVMEFSAARIMGATALPFPAFAEAKQEVVMASILAGKMSAVCVPSALTADAGDDEALVRSALEGNDEAMAAFDRLMSGGTEDDGEAEPMVEGDLAGLVASIDPPLHPPLAWFQHPGDQCGSWTVTDEGRVFAYLATWDQCHIGMPGCVKPPRSELSYAAFLTGELVTEEGTRVKVGQITMDAGHADTKLGSRKAKEHYDHTGWAAADVTVGEDERGIWIAGALRPGLDPKKVRAALAADISGDWRTINGNLELVGIASVNVPGFPKLLVASGEVTGLILPPANCDGYSNERGAKLRIAASIGRHPAQLAKERKAAIKALAKRRWGMV